MSAPAGALLRGWAGRRRLAGGVSSYKALLYLGCTTGVFAGAAVAGATGLEPARFALAVVALLVPALAGARLWFVAEHWPVYRREPSRIWRRAEGGSALHGGLLLSVAVSVPLLALFGLPFGRFWDAASFTMLVGLIFTRAGCVMNGCCGGRPTAGPLGMWLPDERGAWERRIPTQLLEAGWVALILVAALIARPSAPFAGATFLGVVAVYGVGRLALEPTRRAGGSRANLAVAALLVVLTAIVFLIDANW